MRCLSAAVEPIRESFNATCSRISDFNSSVSVTDMFSHVINLIRDAIYPEAKLVRDYNASVSVNGGLSIQFGMVCSVGDLKYLDVTPKSIRFFQGHLSEYVTIISNTVWKAIKQ